MNRVAGTSPLKQTPLPATPKPLYVQVGEGLIQRIVSGEWGPGELLPSEAKLAAEYGVHQGTVRKALETMEAQRLLVRLQGKGTFVSDASTRHEAFRFFRIRPRSEDGTTGPLIQPATKILSCTTRKASRAERAKLQLGDGETQVVRLQRLRLFDAKPVIVEHIAMSADRFPGLEAMLNQLRPDTNYGLLEQKYRVLINRVTERLSAVAASTQDAKLLAVPESTPLLQIERIAFSLDSQPVEVRVSRCLNEAYDYHVEFS